MRGIVLCRIEPDGSVITVIDPADGSKVWEATVPSKVAHVEVGICPDIQNGRLSPDFRYLGVTLGVADGGTHAGIYDLTTTKTRDVSGVDAPDPNAFAQEAIQDSAPVFSTPTEFFWNRAPVDGSVFGRVLRGTLSGNVVEDVASQEDVAGDASTRLGAQGGFVYGNDQGSARVASPQVDAFIYLSRVCSEVKSGLVMRVAQEQCPEVLGAPINFEANIVAMLGSSSYLYKSGQAVELSATSSGGTSYLQESSTRSLFADTTRSVKAVALSSSGTRVLLIVDGELWWVPSDANNAAPNRVPNSATTSDVIGWLD